jgi:RNA polymerase-binding protein DksA
LEKNKRRFNRMRKKLNRKDLTAFKKLILKFKEKILEDIKHISEDTLKKSQKEACGDISGYTYHMADVATDTYDREFSLELVSNERTLLYELDEALKKIEEGTFGICESCKLPIAKNRLRALLYARLCVKCQKTKEKS